ncbi:MAG: hypothetical protein IJW46_03245 [Clostridia bacterium]|nr:hypothetical protein [Clostridia bacterium]
MKKRTENPESYRSDCEAFTEYDVSDMTEKGITLKNGRFIDFAVCCEVWAYINAHEITTCVGDRNIIEGEFVFYTPQKPVLIRFIKKGKLAERFLKNNTRHRFYHFRLRIEECGYMTFDLT